MRTALNSVYLFAVGTVGNREILVDTGEAKQEKAHEPERIDIGSASVVRAPGKAIRISGVSPDLAENTGGKHDQRST